MSLINSADIYTISGLSDDALTFFIPYAEAQAEAMLGYLEKEDKTQEIYMWDKSDVLKLDFYPVNSVSSITYTLDASDDEETFETDEYRVIKDEGLIIFDEEVPEKYLLKVTYEIGWDQSSVTPLVKLLLVTLAISQYYSLNPSQAQHSQVLVSERIGDHAIKYASMGKDEFKSLEEWADYLATLIKKGGTIPDVHSA